MSQADQLIEAASALTAASSQYASVSNAEVGISTSIAYLVGDLQKTWQGKASQGFMSAWNRAVRDAANSSEALAHASTSMSTLASTINKNVQPFEDLAHAEIHDTDLKAIAKAKQAVEAATKAIQSAASTAEGELQGLLSTVGTCSVGTEALPKGWSVTLKNKVVYKKKGQSMRAGWYEVRSGEGGASYLEPLNWSGGEDKPPPDNILNNDCTADPFDWKAFKATLGYGIAGGMVSPLLASPNKHILLSTAVSSASSTAISSTYTYLYDKMKQKWQVVCNASKNPKYDKIPSFLAGITSAFAGAKLITPVLNPTPPTPKPKPAPTVTVTKPGPTVTVTATPTPKPKPAPTTKPTPRPTP